ncbi:MAG: glycosyltransferase [Pseudonocardia sp.]|nr:glycosyltransferase [Pseudonocardia sp.]
MDDSQNGRAGELPRVAVVMPVRDMDPVLVCRAVASVYAQSYRGPIDLQLWDDGSSTYDYRFADQWMDGRESAGERRVYPHRWEFSRGIAAARNAGADASTAPWLLWLDGDDELPADAVELLVTATDGHGDVEFVIGQCDIAHAGGMPRRHWNLPYLETWRTAFGTSEDPAARTVFPMYGGLVSRRLFTASGRFDPEFTHAPLVDWFLRMLLRVVEDDRQIVVLNEATYLHHKRPGSHSSDRRTVHAQRREALRRYALRAGVPGPVFEMLVTDPHTGARSYGVHVRAGAERFPWFPPAAENPAVQDPAVQDPATDTAAAASAGAEALSP